MADSEVFDNAVSRMLRIGEEAGIGRETLAALRQPEATLMASLTVRVDDGSTRYFPAYRCRYNDAPGPTKRRLHPGVETDRLRRQQPRNERVLCRWLGLTQAD